MHLKDQAMVNQVNANKLHQAVLNEIESLLKQLSLEVTDKRVAETIKQVNSIVTPIRRDLVKRIKELQHHARWGKFTIAFYGETNAGKSTIIETLRILLNEKTKVVARGKFRETQEALGLSESKLSELQQLVNDSRSHLDELCAHISKSTAQLDAEMYTLEQESSRLNLQVNERKRAASFWRKLLDLIHKCPEEVALEGVNRERLELEAIHTTKRDQLNTQLGHAQKEHRVLEARLSSAHSSLDCLMPWADGEIVGTGRSDYTLDTHGYVFDMNGQHFELLDVPGIEGKEVRVIDSILGAVRAAHAVFYVTGKAAAPQTGGENGQGTLEKINEHLGDQTEVWTLYNKRITNLIQLEKDELLSQGEQDSLAVLDETMREYLGDRYQRSIALSAQPAFLAAADCLIPLSDIARSRAKFLAKSSVKDLLLKSGFQSFLDWLTGSMVSDCDTRIRIANINKVRSAIQVATGTIAQIQRDTVAPLAVQLKHDWVHVDQQLELAVRGLGPALQSLADGAIHTFETSVRRRVYTRIEDGIGNDDLKHVLGSAIQSEQVKLESDLPVHMTAQLKRFQQDVTDVLERFQRRAEQLQDAYNSVSSPTFSGFELNMKFDSGVNYMSLVTALAGGLMMLWNPVGWISLAIGGVTLIVSVAKALRGFFDSDYKKSQQRKVVNDNLERIVDSMRNEMKRSCDEVMEKVTEQIEAIAAEVKQSITQVAHVNSVLIRVCSNLSHLSTKISETEVV